MLVADALGLASDKLASKLDAEIDLLREIAGEDAREAQPQARGAGGVPVAGGGVEPDVDFARIVPFPLRKERRGELVQRECVNDRPLRIAESAVYLDRRARELLGLRKARLFAQNMGKRGRDLGGVGVIFADGLKAAQHGAADIGLGLDETALLRLGLAFEIQGKVDGRLERAGGRLVRPIGGLRQRVAQERLRLAIAELCLAKLAARVQKARATVLDIRFP
jgi:hypothetical protein